MIGDTPYDAEAASGAGTCSRRASYRWVCKQALLEAGRFGMKADIVTVRRHFSNVP